MTKISLIRTLVGAIINIILNIILIPILGLIGAAVTTIISYTFATILLLLFYKETRGQVAMMLRSFIFWKILSLSK